MKNFVAALLITATALCSVAWCALTSFGKRTGVYITQRVNHRNKLQDKYDISTFIWCANWMGTNGSIEYSDYATVGYCKIDSTKQSQKRKAEIRRLEINQLLKEIKEPVCP